MSDPLQELCRDWFRAKERENKAVDERWEIEKKIVAITGKKEEGSSTVKAGESFKVTVTGTVSRKMDWAKWESVKDKVPAQLHPVKTKLELDEKGVKYLRDNEPEIYKLLPIEVKEGKTGIKIEVTQI